MRKAIGVILLLAAGVMGNMAFQAYQDENRAPNAINESVIGSVIQVRKEIPMQTYVLGIGAVMALALGITLVLKK